MTVSRFEVLARARDADGFVDLDVVVDCSSGTYIRALARDLGAALGVGGHLTALRRTRVGPFDVDGAASVDDLAGAPLARPGRGRHRRCSARSTSRPTKRATSATASASPAPRPACTRPGRRDRPDGALVGIVERRGDDVKSVMNMPEEASA